MPDFQKKKILGMRCQGITDAGYGSALRYARAFRGAVVWTALHTNLAAFNCWNDDERKVNVNRNDNDWNDNWWFAGLRNYLHFSPTGEFYFAICPLQPPSILPISSIDIWIFSAD